MDCGACLGCGFGIDVPLQTDNNQNVTWHSGKPNPLPIFKVPNEFYTPTLLPGLYLPIKLVTPYEVQDGLPYNPLSNVDLVKKLVGFLLHESVHQTLLLSIIPTTQRLVAANSYTALAVQLSGGFDPKFWDILNGLNYTTKLIHDATAPMHEVAAIVENQITIPCDHPYIHELSEASANSYKKRYGSNFERQYNTFHSLITRLKEQFAPTPLQRKTIITLADHIISLAIDLQGFTKNVLRFPEPIPDASLREDIMRTGIPYLDRPNPTLKKMPSIGVGFIDGFTVYDIGELLNHIKSTIFSAKFKRKRQMPENYIDQLLYIAKLVPELKLWLQSIDAYHWLKRRFLNAIADHQLHLEAQGFLLPLTEVWQSDLSAFASIKTALVDSYGTYKTLYTYSIGKQPDHFAAIARKIPHKYWIAYSRQKYEPLGVMYSPRCKDGIPISPYAFAIRTPEATELYRCVMNMIIFESIRMQIAEGCGLVCPWYGLSFEEKDTQDRNCCGRTAIIWQAYNLGLKAIDKADWQPTDWIAPECKQPKTKNLHT